jgi:hypothetical protein
MNAAWTDPNAHWIKGVFGPEATLLQKLFPVIVRGIPLSAAQKDNSRLLQEISLENGVYIAKGKAMRIRDGSRAASLIFHLPSTTDANKQSVRVTSQYV